MKELNIVYKNIKELKPYKKNAKKHSKEQVEQIKAYRLVDNRLNESDWDFSLLDEELGILSDDIDMELFGFDTDMSDEELERAIKEVKFKTKEKHLVIVPCKSEKEI